MNFFSLKPYGRAGVTNVCKHAYFTVSYGNSIYNVPVRSNLFCARWFTTAPYRVEARDIIKRCVNGGKDDVVFFLFFSIDHFYFEIPRVVLDHRCCLLGAEPPLQLSFWFI